MVQRQEYCTRKTEQNTQRLERNRQKTESDRQEVGQNLQKRSRKKWSIPWKKILDLSLNLLYPRRCPLCDEILKRRETFCCKSCEKKLPWIRQPFCMKCGKPLAHMEDEFCDDCSKGTHRFDRGIAPFTYTGALRHSIYRMKKENRRDYLDFYAEMMAEALEPYLTVWKPERILAVPMHWSKKWKRGYNQSELLAKKVSQKTGIPYEKNLFICKKKPQEQKLLGRRERQKNLQGCFALRQGKENGFDRVLLIDDVYTTGSTMDVLADLLKKSGTSYVFFLVLCTGKGKKRVCTGENVCYTKSESGPFRKGSV